MSPRPRYLSGRQARRIEQLLGLQGYSLRAVERRADGAYALVIRTQRVGGEFTRVVRLTAHRVEAVKATTLAQHLQWRFGVALSEDETIELRWLVFLLAIADELRHLGIRVVRDHVQVNGDRQAA